MFNKLKTAKVAALGLAVAVTSLGFAGTSAQAATVEVQYEGDNVWGTPRWARSVSYIWNGENFRHGAGLFRMQDADTGASILAWCIDLAQRIRASETYDMMTPVATDAQMENIDRLFTSGYASVNDSDSAAGFQLALWEIMADTDSADGLDLSTGDFQTTLDSGAYAAAAGFLDNIGTETGGYELTTLFSARAQDLVTASDLTPAAVPLPASALLLLSGVAGAGFVGRRRRKS